MAGKTQFKGSQILDETLTSEDIKDGEVKRDDLNTTEVGQSVVRKIIAGSGVTLTSTGVDSGTGDVTIEASGGGSGDNNIDGGFANSVYLPDQCFDGGGA